jgi:hypothetical protein
MTWVATAIAGSAAVGLYSANKASGTQAASADQAAQLQERMFNKQVELQEPWRQAGVNALNRMQSGDVMGMMDPSYQFRLGEGLKSLDRTAAARGGLISGGALKAAQRYGQDFASQEFGNAYNRLAGLAGVGQTATGAMGNAAGAYGTNAGNLMTGSGAARASGYVGGANALTSGLGQYLNYTQGQNMLGMLQGGGGGANASAAINPYFASTPGVGGTTPL